MSRLDDLSEPRRQDVLTAVRVLDEAENPVPRSFLHALGDESLRAVLEEILAHGGRILIETPYGFTTGYDDVVRLQLATIGIGVLPPVDRAVLTLILLWSVAIPRAQGEIAPDAPWTEGRAVNPRELSSRSRFPETVVTSVLRRLRDAGIVGWGEHRWVVPGPQFLRLAERVQADIFQDLVLLAEPTGALADSIRRLRAARLDGSTR
ncbi:MAG: hypothetical protein ACRDJC_00775 [Thermomicrobiales bacterium]